MIEVTHKFNTVEEAAAFINSLTAGQPAAPVVAAPHYSAPAAVAPNVPAPAPQVVPSQPGQFIPPQQPPAPAPVAAPVTAPATVAAPAAVESGITAAQLATAAQNYSKLYKAAATKAVFAHFGITKIGEAHPSIYPQLLAALTPQAA